MRIVKDYETRKTEIVEISEKLFLLKGYENCTVLDIVKQLSIAKGTFLLFSYPRRCFG